MENYTLPSNPTLTSLPIELQQLILCHLSDVASLKAAALSCRTLHGAFKHAQLMIAKHVLRNQVPRRYFAEAVVHHFLTGLGWDRTGDEKVAEFERILGEMKDGKDTDLLSSLTLSDVLAIADRHTVVHYFSETLAEAAMSKDPLDQTASTPVTQTERNRICAAFYHSDQLMAIWRSSERPVSDAYGCIARLIRVLRTWLLSRYASQDVLIEQILCVHDFLAESIYTVYSDIAAHDVAPGFAKLEWGVGKYGPNHHGGFDKHSFTIQYFLIQGHPRLWQIVYADSYPKRRYQVVEHGNRPQRNCYDFVDWALRQWMLMEDPIVPSSHLSDTDTGPEMALAWAYSRFGFRLDSPDQQELRNWGYVFWDRLRFEATGLMVRDSFEYLEGLNPPEEREFNELEVHCSRQCRGFLLKCSARGWWSHDTPDDWSRLTWIKNEPGEGEVRGRLVQYMDRWAEALQAGPIEPMEGESRPWAIVREADSLLNNDESK